MKKMSAMILLTTILLCNTGFSDPAGVTELLSDSNWIILDATNQNISATSVISATYNINSVSGIAIFTIISPTDSLIVQGETTRLILNGPFPDLKITPELSIPVANSLPVTVTTDVEYFVPLRAWLGLQYGNQAQSEISYADYFYLHEKVKPTVIRFRFDFDAVDNLTERYDYRLFVKKLVP